MLRFKHLLALFVGILFTANAAMAGKIVLTGPDQDFHGFRGASNPAGNQYNLLLNSVQFVSPVAVPRIAAIGGNFGNQAGNAIPLDIPGATVARLTSGAFNALTPAQLRASYDVLIFTWSSSSSQNNDWNTRLLPYLSLGGGIIYEDDGNIGDLAPAVSGFQSGASGIGVTAAVPGLTDGIADSFVNNHIVFTAWDPALSPFLGSNQGVVGLYGEFAVPEPASIAVWSVLLLIVVGATFYMRRRKLLPVTN